MCGANPRQLKYLLQSNEVVNMAARLTDKQKKKIVADYLESGSYRATGKKNGVSDGTVKRIVGECGDIQQKMEQKKEQNTADILAYMESKRQEVCGIIDIGLSVLPDKIRDARTASEVTTALGTLIDKFTANGRGIGDTREKDPLSKSLEEMAKGLESD